MQQEYFRVFRCTCKMNRRPALVIFLVNVARIYNSANLREVMAPDGYMEEGPVPNSVGLVQNPNIFVSLV